MQHTRITKGPPIGEEKSDQTRRNEYANELIDLSLSLSFHLLDL